MAGNYLEQLVAEWYEFRGYFLRRNVWVGKLAKGGHECELDVVAFNPETQDLVHIEASMDAQSWDQREQRYRRKFDAGRKHIPNLFKGVELPKLPRQVALVGFGSNKNRKVVGGGTILLVPELLREILTDLKKRPIPTMAVSEQFSLLRTLQFVAQYYDVVSSCLKMDSN